ncbi:hybrid sensor histidine kinase/response regulator [Teichococcus aestuarii]|uniref:histidine kinase n=1 Tax=Teichococcus aestuarii TaxID=568898 RepID=A0A2U1V4D9_9PROT|nr:PAS domain S-box protein [Pseudoroseomonas aestuarii]PWC28788.1 hybrid sensor histidine kinase/response regulator [Pseudoroseomonas aestuarii]
MCLAGGGEAGARLRAVDWASNPLGPVEGWPLSLRTAVRIILSSDFPMMIHWGPELVTFYNDAYAPSLGRKHPGNLGRPAYEWWSEMWDQLTPIFNRVLSGESFFVENARYTPDRDGAPKDAYFTHCHSPLWDDHGKITGIFLVVTETTRQVVAERDLLQANAALAQQNEALQASKARLAAVVSASSEVLYSMSADWAEMHQLTGNGFLVDTGSANPHWLADYIPEDEQARVTAAIQEAIRNQTVFSLEHRVRLAAGGVGWTQSKAVPLLGPAGEITEWFGTANDVTARRVAEEALRRLNESLEQQVAERTADRNRLWTLSKDIMLVAGFDGTIQATNPAWAATLGWTQDDLVGRNLLDLIHPEDHERTAECTSAIAGGQAFRRFENRYRHTDGTYRWIAWTGGPGDGLIIAAGRDITEEKATADALRKAEEQLRQAQKMEAVGQLTGGLAHDFNNLLTGIIGSLELLQARVAEGRIGALDRYIGAARGAADRAAAVTHRLLAFSRRQTLDPKPTDMNWLVGDMGDLIRRTVGPAITVDIVGEPGLPPVLIDPNQLENALLNLCINARDAMPDGSRLVIETGRQGLDARAADDLGVPAGDFLTLCVTDNGTGMAPDVIARAFDPFFTTKPLGEGTGLGLSMIYGFAHQSGSQVHIASEPGQGTRVCLYLPPHAGRPVTGESPVELAEAPRAQQGETVLVVDDEPTVRMLVTEVLGELGYTAIEAADGAEGLNMLRSNAHIDLLVTDVGLPGGMNGRQMAEAGRVLRPGLKVLFITGYADSAVLSHGHLSEGMQVMVKPFSMEGLATRVRAMIAEA